MAGPATPEGIKVMSEAFIIYTVGDQDHGLGHVKRCIVLARELAQRGIGSIFVTAHETSGARVLRDAGLVVYEYAPGDLSWSALSGQYHNLIIDIKGDPSERLMDVVRPLFNKVVVISAAGYSPQGV